MALKFGTSGVRGLVVEMTDRACFHYGVVFGRYLKQCSGAKGVAMAGDHRWSTGRIIAAVGLALQKEGFVVENCGRIPTPAVALHAMGRGDGAIMVTGSHIPEDRNGIKFYMPWGEILKPDEEVMTQMISSLDLGEWDDLFDEHGALKEEVTVPSEVGQARESFIKRYLSFFPTKALEGLKLVVYQHSTVLREIYIEVLESLGAEVIPVGWSDRFVPVDTEAVENPERLKKWVLEHGADALISADGDGDRPLLVNGGGDVIRGDVLGIMASRVLKAKGVATPVSCNSALELSNYFQKIVRCRIGSPWVIAAMKELEEAAIEPVVGYEANGGFLTGSDLMLEKCSGVLKALPTRDAILPILAVLWESRSFSLVDQEAALPHRLTESLLLRGVDMNKGAELIAELTSGSGKPSFEETFGTLKSIDTTDGVRCHLSSGDVVHFRPSGNAPEFRAYLEAAGRDELAHLRSKAESFLIGRIS